jgi:hypothetical protein
VGAALEDEQHTIALLKDLEWKRRRHHPRDAGRQAPRLGIVLLQVRLAFLVHRLRPRLKRNVHDVLDRRATRVADAGDVRDNARIPGSVAIAQIRMTVRQARRGARGFRSGALRHSAGDRSGLRIAGSSERVDENRASEDGSHAR